MQEQPPISTADATAVELASEILDCDPSTIYGDEALLLAEAVLEADQVMKNFPWKEEDPACEKMLTWLKKYSAS